MASTYEEWYAWYNANYPGYSEELKVAQAKKQVSIKNTVPPASQQAPGVGTSGVSQKALDAANTATDGTTSGKSVSQGAIPTVAIGPDGKPLKPSTPLYSAGAEYDYFNNLPPEERTKIQKQMYALGLYGQTAPTYGYIDDKDYSAVKKLMVAGAQIGKADIRDVITQAKTDKTLKNYLVGNTGGAVTKVTDLATAEAKLNQYYLDMFNEKPTKEEVAAYRSALNSAERVAKGSISSAQAEEILLKVASNKVNKLTTAATTGDAKAKAALDTGQLGKTVREIRNAYADNGIPVSDSLVYQKAGLAMRSPTAYDNVMEDIKIAAKTQWVGFADGIDKGRSVKTQLTPFMGLKASIVGIPVESLNVSDMADVLNADGTVKTYQQYKKDVYNSPAYMNSDNRKARDLNDAQALITGLGIVK